MACVPSDYEIGVLQRTEEFFKLEYGFVAIKENFKNLWLHELAKEYILKSIARFILR